jgi:hypothetical protein
MYFITRLIQKPHFWLFISILPFLFIFPQYRETVVPGWHTTIPNYLSGMEIIFFIFLSIFIYWYLSKKERKLATFFTFLHLIITISVVYLQIFNSEILYFLLGKRYMGWSMILSEVSPLFFLIFLIMQFIFIVLAFKKISSK